MSTLSTQLSKETGCPITRATVVNTTDYLNQTSSSLCLIITPTAAGVGTLAVSWRDSILGVVQTARDPFGNPVVINLEAAATLLVSGLDVAEIILTPTVSSGITSFSYSCTAMNSGNAQAAGFVLMNAGSVSPGGKVKRVSVTGITAAAGAIVAGVCVGGKQTFADVLRSGVESGLIQFVSVDMLAARSTGMSLWLFNADPTSSTLTDGAAFVLHKDDVLKRVGVVPLSLTGVAGAGGGNGIQSVYTSGPIALPVSGTTNGTLYGVLVADVATTLVANDIQKITISALPD